jgi:copper transport protein
MTRTLHRVAVPVLAAVLALLLSPAGPASGHASLRSTTPADGGEGPADIGEVTLTFNELVTVPAGGIRVFDEGGERVDEGDPGSASPDTVRVGVPQLGAGNYIVTWRVVSADGHPIKGAFVFTVGEAEAVDDEVVARLFAGGDDTAVAVAAAVTRAVGYAGTLLAAGAAIYLLVVAGVDGRERQRARRWLRRGAAAGLAAALLTVPLQAMASTGFGPAEVFTPTVLGDTLASSVGIAAAVRVAALIAALLLVRTSDARLLTAVCAVAVAAFLVDGHTRTVEPLWLMVVADAVHLAAAAAWFGGLVVLAAMLRQRAFDDDPVSAARLVARYSTLATVAVTAVTVAGVAMSWAVVRQPRALTSTAYGWTLVAKVVLAGIIIAIGVVNNRRLVPAITNATIPVPAGGSTDEATHDAPAAVPASPAGWRLLRRTVRIEAALMVAVLAVTGFLVNLRPAAEEAGITGVFETYASITDDLDLNLVVDPNHAGPNEIHLYVLDRTGRPVQDLDRVTLQLRLPSKDVGPIRREPFVAGPGHWQLNGNELSIPGQWIIDVVVRVDRFTERTVSVPVTVNPS